MTLRYVCQTKYHCYILKVSKACSRKPINKNFIKESCCTDRSSCFLIVPFPLVLACMQELKEMLYLMIGLIFHSIQIPFHKTMHFFYYYYIPLNVVTYNVLTSVQNKVFSSSINYIYMIQLCQFYYILVMYLCMYIQCIGIS